MLSLVLLSMFFIVDSIFRFFLFRHLCSKRREFLLTRVWFPWLSLSGFSLSTYVVSVGLCGVMDIVLGVVVDVALGVPKDIVVGPCRWEGVGVLVGFVVARVGVGVVGIDFSLFLLESISFFRLLRSLVPNLHFGRVGSLGLVPLCIRRRLRLGKGGGFGCKCSVGCTVVVVGFCFR